MWERVALTCGYEYTPARRLYAITETERKREYGRQSSNEVDKDEDDGRADNDFGNNYVSLPGDYRNPFTSRLYISGTTLLSRAVDATVGHTTWRVSG